MPLIVKIGNFKEVFVMNNKKYISLGVLAAMLIVWLAAPIITISIMGFSESATMLDLFSAESFGIADILIMLAPIAAIVCGAVGTFVKPEIKKLGALISAAAFVVGFILQIVSGLEFGFIGWGLWVLLLLHAADAVLNIKE